MKKSLSLLLTVSIMIPIAAGGSALPGKHESGRDGVVPITDTVFMKNVSELREVLVEAQKHKFLHMLAYVREYSTVSTYTDTVFLFREKMVDYMLSPDKKTRLKGWHSPRVLTCRSYYRFTDSHGLDSVSDVSNYHFSWSDWIGVARTKQLPPELTACEYATDTIMGRYSPSEIWRKDSDRVTVDINVLADTTSRRWVPDVSGFFSNGLDFENLKIQYNFDNVTGDILSPTDLTGYTIQIESNGRGRRMFMFNRINEPIYVTTRAEVFMLDKEYITAKEARKWQNNTFDTDEIGIFEPDNVPELQPSILALIERVNNIDRDHIRTGIKPDHRLVSNNLNGRNFKIGYRALNLLKELTGITLFKSRKNFNRNWKNFKKEWQEAVSNEK